MKVRSDILTSRRSALLGGATLMALIQATGALAADPLPAKAAPAADTSGWYSNGTIEAGSNFFIQKPGTGFGKTSTDPFWLTPTTSNSNAKMDEYGKVPRNVFLNEVGVQAGSKDGRYNVDVWADNVGMDNQSYKLYLYEPGRQYFNMGWEQTPHLLSSSAKSIFGGVGSNRLTVDSATRTLLQSNLGPATQTQAQRNAIESYIDNTAPMSNIELKTLREKASLGYRNTMLDNWDFNFNYTNEHRTGTRPLGIGYGTSLTTAAGVPAAPRPASGSIEVPQPINDRTHDVNGAGEYSGTTPWGTRWNTSVQYAGSFYNNDVKSMTVDNPFCVTCVAANGGSVASGTRIGPNQLQYGLAPNNSANGATWNTAIDLPLFKTRYVSTLQYTQFRQNDAFLNDATNGITTLAAYPAGSLNGAVNAFLSNNVLTSRLTSELSNTARVRYYDRKDNTPRLAFTNYVYADNGTATTAPLTRNPSSYSKLNISDDLKWQPNRAWTFGAGYFLERFVFQNGEVDSTNENGVKAFVDYKPWSWVTARNSLEYSQRRYNTWLAATSTDAAANAMRQFFVQNRNRTKATSMVEVELVKNVTVSPNGGLRWDEYPTDRALNAVNALTNTLGTRYDRSWNLGSDLGVRVSPELRMTFGYNHEEHYLGLQSCCGGAAGGFLESNTWSSNITQKYNTYMVSADWNAIPGKLDFKFDFLAAISNEANSTTACTSGLAGCTGNNSAGTTSPFPDEHNRFLRFSALAKYYVDPAYVKQMGWNGQVIAKLRYVWEQNRNTNWATDNFSPYSPSAADAGGGDISSGGRSLFLAYNNPNYTAQIVTAAIAVKW